MFNLIAGAFASVAVAWSGLFGGHASSTAAQQPPMPHMPHVGSTTPDHWNASSTPGHMGSTTPRGGWGSGHMGSTTAARMPGLGIPGVMGKVVSVSGKTITLTGRSEESSSTATYTIDASSARIMTKDSLSATSTVPLSTIKVGDTLIVAGKRSGTSITASIIVDGVPTQQEITNGIRNFFPGGPKK